MQGPGRLAVLLPGAALALAACGSTGTSAPPVRTLPAVSSIAAPDAGSAAPTSIAPSPTARPTHRPSPSASTPRAGTALAALATLTVKGRAPKTGYDRSAFGRAWTDDNDDPLGHNGCDTRNDMLRRDLRDVTVKAGTGGGPPADGGVAGGGGCLVLRGVLHDPYTATTIDFVRGTRTSDAVQIDHVVALSDAWQKGAQYWSRDKRVDLANDPLELLAVDGPTNEAKGDGDAATWLPPNKAFRCAYVARQIAVKARYGLWVTAAEHDAMARVLSACPSQPLPTEAAASAVPAAAHTGYATSATPAPAPVLPTSTDVYYARCADVPADKKPIYRGQPGYRAGLDRDGDGIACEK